MNSIKTKLALAAVVSCSLLVLSGCNTARGFGADVEELGRMIQGKPKDEQVVEVVETTTEAPAPVYVQPAPGVETYPYQGGASYPVEPIQPQASPKKDPTLGEIVPAKTIKEM